jgi:glycosyltransferase involved in cell wall biosynthesis
VWSYVTANEGFARRVLDYLSFMVSGAIAALFVRRVDVIVGTSPQFFTACAACLVGAVRRTPWVFELRDLWPESIKAVGAMKDSRTLHWLEKLELFLYRRAARIVSVTHSFRADLQRRGIDAAKIDVITNGVDIAQFTPRPKDEALVRELGLQGKFVAGYVGTHGLAHSLETLLQAADRLQREPGAERFAILLLGDGARKAELKSLAASMGLRNVVFVDSVPKNQVAHYWALLDASIVHLRRTELFQTVIPSKLFECMGMGIPVLHGVEGESADIVRREGVGIVFEPENAAELVRALRRLADDPAWADQLRQRGLAAARRYDRSALAKEMLHSLEQAASRGGRGSR